MIPGRARVARADASVPAAVENRRCAASLTRRGRRYSDTGLNKCPTMTDVAGNQTSGSGAEHGRITRRELLIDTVVGLTFATPILAAVFAAVRYIIPPARVITGAAERVQVAAVADVAAGQSKDFIYRDAPYALIRIDNEFRAFSKVCTHLGCIVDWKGNERIFRCPCHNAVFDASGSVVSGPAPRPLPHLKVEVAGGKVYVSA